MGGSISEAPSDQGRGLFAGPARPGAAALTWSSGSHAVSVPFQHCFRLLATISTDAALLLAGLLKGRSQLCWNGGIPVLGSSVRQHRKGTMMIKKAILGGAAATALVFGSLLAAAGPAGAATSTGNGQQQCNSLFWNLNSDQDTLHFWQLQRAQDAGHGLSTGFDDYEIDFYFNQIDQDVQALNDAGC